VAANRLRAVCTDAEMVDIFKASITTEVPNISENEKRLLHYFLNWVENPGNAERTWSEVKTEVIRIAQRGDAKSEQARSLSRECRASSNRALTVCRCEGRTTKMLGSRTTNYSFMTAVEDAGERLRLHSAGRFKAPTGEVQHHWSRGHGAGEGSGRQRSGGRSPSICWYWERTGTCQRGTGCLGSHSYCQQPSA
jgi:hypothetical protein